MLIRRAGEIIIKVHCPSNPSSWPAQSALNVPRLRAGVTLAKLVISSGGGRAG